MSHNEELLRALVENLRAEDRDTITRENVLGALQKLSLRYDNAIFSRSSYHQQDLGIQLGIVKSVSQSINVEVADINCQCGM